ncbi:hypothetical protein QYM36_019554 [Artemia franciscana]|uniref:Type III pantothenate kinase n=1 Tax=Artemia franciscana TaxID=6661 RepID=A0AA88H7Q2_ARTSF|nr:hypothetical protein QYM36_019554 [Artemia franciscana]
MTRLLIDVGNTRIKLALSEQGEFIDRDQFRWQESDLTQHFHQITSQWRTPSEVAVSNVAGPSVERLINTYCEKNWRVTPRFAKTQSECGGLMNVYPKPETLGIDRWLAMLGAWHPRRKAVCVIDCGSAVTIDRVNEAGQHLGGLIAPDENTVSQLLADNTQDAINSGCEHLFIDGLNGILERLEQAYEANVAYFGWHMNQQIDQVQTHSAMDKKPEMASSKPLVLLSEMDRLPPLREESAIPNEGQATDLATHDLIDQSPEFNLDGTAYRRSAHPRALLWVYLEPKATEAEARAQVEQLKQQGVSDYYMVTKGNMKNAISLGLFSSQETVNRRLEELAKEGYQPVVIPQHKVEQKVYINAQLNAEQSNLNLPNLPNSIKVENKACSEIALNETDH